MSALGEGQVDARRTDVEQHDGGLAPGAGHAEAEGAEALQQVRRRGQHRAGRRLQLHQDVAGMQVCAQKEHIKSEALKQG